MRNFRIAMERVSSVSEVGRMEVEHPGKDGVSKKRVLKEVVEGGCGIG
jgi:hypothetical protein